MPIHPTAIVSSDAQIHPDARVDAYAVIEGAVRIAAGCHIFPHAFVAGWTELEEGCVVHPNAVVGHAPQDFSYDGSESYCRIGAGTIIREFVSVHRGADPGSVTTVGRRCMLMACSHVAHNCQVGDDVVTANCALLAGHVHVGDRSFVGGGAAIHQFVRIGTLCMIAGNARVTRDIPPYMLTDGEGEIVGPNVVGLRRGGLDASARKDVKNAYRQLYRENTHFTEAAQALRDTITTDAGRAFAAFVCQDSKRGFAPASRRRKAAPASG